MADNANYANDVANKAEGLKQDLANAVADLIEAAGEQLDATFDIDDYVTDFSVPDWNIIEPPDIPKPSAELPAGWNGINVPAFTFNPEDYISADLLQRYSYDSDFFDNFLDSRLRTYIDSQSYFLAQEVQDALFETSRERDLQTLNDALDAVDRVQARKGFPLPTSVHLAARNDVIKKYQDTRTDRNNEITALIADKSLQEKMHAMDTGIKMEDIRSRFQLEYNKIYWQAADYLIRKFETDVRAEIARVDAEYKMFALTTGVETKNVEIELEEEQLKNDKEKARLGAEIAELQQQISVWQKTYEARIEAAKETVKYYQSYIMGLLGSYNAIDYADKTE